MANGVNRVMATIGKDDQQYAMRRWMGETASEQPWTNTGHWKK